MPLSRDSMEKRLEGLKEDLEKARQQFVAITGAIAELTHWLAEEAKPAPAPVDSKTPDAP